MLSILVVAGLLLGVLGAHFAHVGKRNFRTRLLKDLRFHRDQRSLEAYVSDLLAHQDKWKRSMSLIRKPFGKQMNLAIETGATLMALLGLVNGLTNFDRVFQSATQGGLVITFLAVVLGFIPSQWFLSAQIEKDMDSVLRDLRIASEKRELDGFLSRVTQRWEK